MKTLLGRIVAAGRIIRLNQHDVKAFRLFDFSLVFTAYQSKIFCMFISFKLAWLRLTHRTDPQLLKRHKIKVIFRPLLLVILKIRYPFFLWNDSIQLSRFQSWPQKIISLSLDGTLSSFSRRFPTNPSRLSK